MGVNMIIFCRSRCATKKISMGQLSYEELSSKSGGGGAGGIKKIFDIFISLYGMTNVVAITNTHQNTCKTKLNLLFNYLLNIFGTRAKNRFIPVLC